MEQADFYAVVSAVVRYVEQADKQAKLDLMTKRITEATSRFSFEGTGLNAAEGGVALGAPRVM
jgi:hypothetical protein